MYNFMYVNICTHTYVNKTYTCTSKKSMYTYIHIYTFIYLYMYIHVYLYMYVSMYGFIHIGIFMHKSRIDSYLINSFI
jgi:hypothetical protein